MGKQQPRCDIGKWGSAAWNFLHCVTLTYPTHPTEEQQQQYKTFFEALGNVLPCPQCRKNYKKKLTSNPLSVRVLSSRQTFFEWLVDVHNSVNMSTNKRKYGYDEAYKLYMTWHDEETDHGDSLLSMIISVSVFGIIIYLFVKWMKRVK